MGDWDSATFLHNTRRFSFHYGLTALRSAYDAALESPEKEKRSLEGAIISFREKVDAGLEEKFVEVDGRTYDFEDHVAEMFDDNNQTIDYIREAFIISLAHFFERQLKKIVSPKKLDYQQSLDYLREKGGDPDPSMLKVLRLCSNVLKHSVGDSANSLIKVAPDMFDVDQMEKNEAVPSYEYLVITSERVDQFFSAVRSAVKR